MNGWIVFFVYLAVALFTARRIVAAIHDDSCKKASRDWSYRDIYLDMDLEDRLMIGVVGLIGGLLWPLAAIILVIVARPPRGHWQRKVQLQEAQERIKQLERELGLGGKR